MLASREWDATVKGSTGARSSCGSQKAFTTGGNRRALGKEHGESLSQLANLYTIGQHETPVPVDSYSLDATAQGV